MKHPLVGVCRLVAEGGNQSPAGRQEDSLVAVLHTVSCFVLRMRESTERRLWRPTESLDS